MAFSRLAGVGAGIRRLSTETHLPKAFAPLLKRPAVFQMGQEEIHISVSSLKDSAVVMVDQNSLVNPVSGIFYRTSIAFIDQKPMSAVITTTEPIGSDLRKTNFDRLSTPQSMDLTVKLFKLFECLSSVSTALPKR